jgi:hypothetical protein
MNNYNLNLKMNTQTQQDKIAKSKKLPYCPIISHYLKQNNNTTLKKPILYEIFNCLEYEEQLEVRLVCKQWNEIVRSIIPELQNENVFELAEKRRFNEDNLFDNSDKKFSKKKVLVNLIHSKNYYIIKKRASLKCMTKAKTLN